MNEMFSARPIASTVKRTYRRHQADQRVKDTQTGASRLIPKAITSTPVMPPASVLAVIIGSGAARA